MNDGLTKIGMHQVPGVFMGATEAIQYRRCAPYRDSWLHARGPADNCVSNLSTSHYSLCKLHLGSPCFKTHPRARSGSSHSSDSEVQLGIPRTSTIMYRKFFVVTIHLRPPNYPIPRGTGAVVYPCEWDIWSQLVTCTFIATSNSQEGWKVNPWDVIVSSPRSQHTCAVVWY